MSSIKYLFHFLGCVHFAISLIGVTTLFIVAGTVIESQTGSHLFAAYYTYQHPAFLILLGLFFINILFAALRRWPFRISHIPFLITHLGLLMILSGIIAKNAVGRQGTLSLVEGSGSHEILLPHTFAVKIQKKNSIDPRQALSSIYLLEGSSPFPELQIETVEYAPHSAEFTETWIKGNQGIIAGLKPFPVFPQESFLDPSPPISARIALFPFPSEPWNLFAFHASDIFDTLRTLYLNGLTLKIIDRITDEPLYEAALKEALITSPEWKNGKARLELIVDSLFFILKVKIDDISKNMQFDLKIPLTGPEGLDQISESFDYLGKIPFAVDLHRSPALLFLQNFTHDTYLFAFDPHGRIHKEPFPSEGLSSLIAYDNGWGGYYAHATIPFFSSQGGRREKEKGDLKIFEQALENAHQASDKLAPPLRMLERACQTAGVDFINCCTEFLDCWDKSWSWLYPLDHPISPLFAKVAHELDWTQEPSPHIKKCCAWLSGFFLEIEPLLRQEISPRKVLEQVRWPAPLPAGDDNFLLTWLTQQIFSVGELLPNPSSEHPNGAIEARLFSAYLRAYGIHLNEMRFSGHASATEESIQLECPITLKHNPKPSLSKIEECIPLVKLKLKKGARTEYLTLAYDRTATGLYWPAFDGEYLLRFQPQSQEIPYHIRLRKARRVDYPHSTQPFSYESDLLITSAAAKISEEKTISMNNVHETWDGFRFYLAGLANPDETTAKRIQLVVNHDPAKYWLTYPGGVILSLGIVLLFWKRKLRNVK